MTTVDAELVNEIVSTPESEKSMKMEEITNTIIDSVKMAGGASVRNMGSTLYVDDEKLKELFTLINNYGKEDN